jgi:cyclic pyranopterin phosphate synthase
MQQTLTPNEIERFVQAATALGISRIRLTGGEPLLRPDLEEIVQRIAANPGIKDVSLTTNAQRLVERALPLSRAGLRRVNVSLDTLDPDRYRRFTGGGEIDRVWAGLEAAEQAGLLPIHLNVVAIKGVNDDEIVDLAKLTLTHHFDVRFIELMSIGATRNLGSGQLLTAETIRDLLGRPEAVQGEQGAGPAKYYHLPGAKGRVGLISAVSEHFCSGCNRIRLTSFGKVRPCLLTEREYDFRPLLAPESPAEQLQAALSRVISQKPIAQPLSPSATRRMSEIGG